MRVGVAFLADYAIAHGDGKLYVVGGGIDHIVAADLPLLIPQLCVVLKVYYPTAEQGRRHSLSIIGRGPGEVVFAPLSAIALTPAVTALEAETLADGAAAEGRESGLPAVWVLRNVRLEQPGRYAFHVFDDSRSVAVLPFTLSTSPRVSGLIPPRVPDPVAELISGGFQEFISGDRSEAERIFAAATGAFPLSADAHNNLGFTRLARGDAIGALAAFVQAKELGYRQLDLLLVNIGCAHYALKQFSASLHQFVEALKIGLNSGPAVLVAVGGSEISPISVRSPGEYQALVALNAAWCALQMERPEEARQFAEAAIIGRRIIADGADIETFSRHLDGLMTALDGT